MKAGDIVSASGMLTFVDENKRAIRTSLGELTGILNERRANGFWLIRNTGGGGQFFLAHQTIISVYKCVGIQDSLESGPGITITRLDIIPLQ